MTKNAKSAIKQDILKATKLARQQMKEKLKNGEFAWALEEFEIRMGRVQWIHDNYMPNKRRQNERDKV